MNFNGLLRTGMERIGHFEYEVRAVFRDRGPITVTSKPRCSNPRILSTVTLAMPPASSGGSSKLIRMIRLFATEDLLKLMNELLNHPVR
jgi:hypothetical protein